MRKSLPSFLFILTLLTAAGLACQISLGGPQPVNDQPTPTAQSLQSLDEAIQQSVTLDPTTGEAQVTITEAQLTQYLTDQMNSQTDPLLRDPQVKLHPGTIEIYGQTQRGIIKANVKASLTAQVDSEGNLQLEIQSADFGPLPVPKQFLNQLSSTVNDATAKQLGSNSTGFRIKNINISEGQMTISGQPR